MPERLTLSSEETARYSRHIILPEIGVDGQERLKAARVLVIGAGGLGSPAALYLAAAGVGTIGLADFDCVEAHNLQRQIMHGTPDVGRPKTESGADRIGNLNPNVRVVQHTDGVQPDNAVSLFSAYDVVLDGSDNFSTRYLNTDAAWFAKRPLVYGSIFKFEGQVSVFHPASGSPCYRCLFPEPPPPGAVPNCAEAGVFGALCGVIGSLQAMEAIKFLTGTGRSLEGRLVVFDALESQFRTINLRKDPDCPLCSDHPQIQAIDAARYDFNCATSADEEGTAAGTATGHETAIEISAGEAAELSRTGKAVLLDVRESFELQICRIDSAEHIPMRQIPEQMSAIPTNRRVLVLCHHGGRSMNIARFLRSQGWSQVSNIRGGIDAWAREVDPALQRY